MSFLRAFIFFILFLSFVGCAVTTDRQAVLASLRGDAKGGAIIEGVPFFSQDEYMCGPAALAGVMAFYGSEDTMDDVGRAVYNEKLRGTLPIDLLAYAKEKGFDASFYKGSLGDLQARLKDGSPLILFLNLGYDFYPVGHYIVATGISERARVVVAHSGTEQDKVYSFIELKKAWSKTGYATLAVRPKGMK